MMQLKVEAFGREFPVMADDDALLEDDRPVEGAPSREQVVAEAAYGYFDLDKPEDLSHKGGRVTVVDADFDSHGISGSNSDGSPIDFDGFNAQITDETWEAFVREGERDGIVFFLRPADVEANLQAGIDTGYRQVAAEIAADEADLRNRKVGQALDQHDLARIAAALEMAWKNALAGSHKNDDPDVRSVLQGMAGAYNQTRAKVEALLDQEEPTF